LIHAYTTRSQTPRQRDSAANRQLISAHQLPPRVSLNAETRIVKPAVARARGPRTAPPTVPPHRTPARWEWAGQCEEARTPPPQVCRIFRDRRCNPP
jgi:hypothetical protein